MKFYVIDIESTGGSAVFKDSNGMVLDTYALQNLGSGANQLVSSNISEIKTIEITNQVASDGFLIDDLEFDILQ